MSLIDREAVVKKMSSVMDWQDTYLPSHFLEMVLDEVPSVPDKPSEMKKKLQYLLESYQDELNELYQERSDHGTSLSGAYMTGKMGVYGKIIIELRQILEEDEEEG